MAPSRYDWKIVDWDVKPQHNQPTLEYLVVRDVNIISVKLRCLNLTFSSVILVRGVGGKLSRLVYLAPGPGFGSNSVIC